MLCTLILFHAGFFPLFLQKKLKMDSDDDDSEDEDDDDCDE